MLAIGAGGLDVAVAMGGGAYYLNCPKVVNVHLTGKLPQDFAYRVLYGADRLLVMADSPIPDLPPVINGVPVEFRGGSAVATTH